MSDVAPVTRSTDEPTVGAALPHTKATSRRARRRSPATPHASRFRVAIVALAGLAVIAVAVAVIAGTQGRGSASAVPQWSAWSPGEGGDQGARDIAEYVAPFYRISAIDQLDVVTVINLESSAAAQAAAQASANGTSTDAQSGLQVAVRPSTSSSQVSLLSGNTIAYNLCGIGGKNCAIGAGKPSANRLLLLRREALELALYTFKYIDNTENVLAVLPPGRTATTATSSRHPASSRGSSSAKPVDIAVLFVRQELAPFLREPVSATLPEQEPPTVAEMPNAPEAGLVDEVTARGLFSEQLQQAQDGTSLILLNPLPAS